MKNELITNNNSVEIYEKIKEYVNDPFGTKDNTVISYLIAGGISLLCFELNGDKKPLNRAVFMTQQYREITNPLYPNEQVQNEYLKFIDNVFEILSQNKN